jgi:hypothetical protein
MKFYEVVAPAYVNEVNAQNDLPDYAILWTILKWK